MLQLIVAVVLLCESRGNVIRSTVPILDGKIVGGERAKIEDYPYQVSLEKHNSHFCGGSIIGPKIILTASHCTFRNAASDIDIRHSTSVRGKGGIVIHTAKVERHPYFDPTTLDNDVSVLVLEAEIVFSASAQPIQLIESGATPTQQSAICTGWGTLSSMGPSPTQLQVVTVTKIDIDICNKSYGGRIYQSMICFGGLGKDACQGDSGGPLALDGMQVGIVSWGRGCALSEYPGVYSNVEHLRDFIDSI